MLNTAYERLEETVQKNLAAKQWESAFQAIKMFVEKIVRNPFCEGIVLEIPGLDNLCQTVGKTISQDIKFDQKLNQALNNTNSRSIVYIATQLYTAGGHTAIIEDYIRSQPQLEHHILLTDIYDAGEEEAIKQRFAGLPVQLHWSPEKMLFEKFVWLKTQWLQLNPAKVFLFNHHADVVIIAAATPDMPGELYYYHHIDYLLGLGKQLAHAVHIDIHPLAYSYCRQYNTKNNVYDPLSCPDLGVREIDPSHFKQDSVLHTASSGGQGKFLAPYRYSYIKLIPEILQATHGTHTHIGFLDEEVLEEIYRGLAEKNIEANRFIYIRHTKSVWKLLQEKNIDLFITSFPIGGARTAIEAMGAGIPLLLHENDKSAFLSEKSLIYPEVLTWQTPEILLKILETMTPEQLAMHAHLGRKHYLTGNKNIEAKKIPLLEIDYLQLFLDISDHLSALKQKNADLKEKILELNEKLAQADADKVQLNLENARLTAEIQAVYNMRYYRLRSRVVPWLKKFGIKV